MPVPELVFELIAPIGRFLVWLFVEVLWELLIKGAGYLVVRPFKRDVTLDSGIVLVVGFALWILVAAVAYRVFISPAS